MDQAKKLLAVLNPRQLATIAIVAIAVVGAVIGFSRWQRENGMKPLYTGLAPEDANAIVQKLHESGVDYKISANGSELLVPEDKVPELRLEMAGLGLPKTGRIGFEIFDKTNFGITDFAEHVNYRRALEGELERSVMAISEVQQARVHVSLPKDSVFTDAREPAKASVLVGLRPGTRLSSTNVVAITNLVSSAVEGLSPESVSVVDMSGNLLSRPRREGASDATQMSDASLEYKQAVEHDLVAKISSTLEPLLGADKFRTGVSADIDMTSGEQSEETFDPSKSVMTSSQKSEDQSGSTRMSSPAPGTAANLPPQQTVPSNAAGGANQANGQQQQQPANGQQTQPGQATPATPAAKPEAARPAGNSTNTTRRSESITYQTSRVTKHIKLPQGTIKRLSIAVLVDQGSHMEGKGAQAHRVVTPPDPEKLKAIQTLVGTLVGLDSMRGDQLTVEALPFDNGLDLTPGSTSAPDAQKKPAPPFSVEAFKEKPALYGGSAAGVVVVIAMLAFVLMRNRKRGVAVETREALPAAPVDAYTGLPSPAAPGTVAAIGEPMRPALMPSRTEVLLNQLTENSRNNAEAWANVLRTWLAEEESN
ncbi:MAG TPA: flagellar basal-body MS-ring/collar protein FliF [Bryobacteraceae bacterium]|nr:flagellar basal-body MS-ring/collar protein FliF [Bryobacteraceae bacterium]